MKTDFTVLPAHPHVHPQSEWAIPAFAFPAAAGIRIGHMCITCDAHDIVSDTIDSLKLDCGWHCRKVQYESWTLNKAEQEHIKA